MIPAAGVLAAILGSSCSQSNQQAPRNTATPASTPASAASTPAFAAFHGTIPANTTNTQCALDIVNGQPAGSASPIAVGSTATFGGWAGNGGGQAANGFELILKGEQQSYSVPLPTGVTRADVADALDSGRMKNAGFNATVSFAGVASGNYALYVASPSNSAEDCDLHRSVTVQ
jgi:hypothetical protein